MASMRRIKLGSQGHEVSAQGLGCMGMFVFHGAPKPEPDMMKLIHHAINSGVIFLDISYIYGSEEMRRNAKKWKDLAREAMSEGGPFDNNLKAFLDI
ncbi:hypothetical protein M0R45_020198 [Rubus argutus]|uniref:NADP-dependent oxidoreductase domain-containing protein n=1 Tax=Rubus argutus TaxID=59490 RepID=A0AAW1X8K3_RUBAR